MNKAQAEKKFYAFNAEFRVDVIDFKPFQKPTGRFPADRFLDPHSMPRLLKTTNRRLNQILLLLRLFQQFLRGSGWLRDYQCDYVIDNYIEPAVI